jgi:peroxiredoxin
MHFLAILLGLLVSANDNTPVPDQWPDEFAPVAVRPTDPAMSSLRRRVRVFLYFSPECSHCQERWPQVQKAISTLRSSDVVVGAIAAQGMERREVLAFAETLGMDNPLWMDSTGEIAQALRIHSVPRAYLVERSGRVQVFRNLTAKRLDDLFAIALRLARRR